MEDDKLLGVETAQYPNLELAQLKFRLSLPEYSRDKAGVKKLKEAIFKDNMAPFYKLVCDDLNWKFSQSKYDAMQEVNNTEIAKLDADVEYASESSSVIELREAYLAKAQFLSKIGEKTETIKYLNMAYDQTVTLRYKIDIVFYLTKIGLFFSDLDLIKTNLQRCEDLLDLGADWHSRNCYKIYKGIYAMCVRNFAEACEKLLDGVATFMCTELLCYDNFIKYTILAGVITLQRSKLKEAVIDNAEIQQVLHEHPKWKEFLMSLYNCDYKLFFFNLAEVETLMKEDMFLHAHYQYYVREMKIKAYNQLLSTYISVSLEYMANQFGVTHDFIEEDISKYIAAGRLNYKIDKVNKKVVNVPTNTKDNLYKDLVKHGDLLLNRIHRLSRVINI